MFHASKRKVSELAVGTSVSNAAVSSDTRTRRRSNRSKLAVLCLIVMVLVTGASAFADTATADQAQRIVAQYSGTFTSAGTWPNTAQTPAGPLMGNGDVGVVVLNGISNMQFVLNKNEFWSLSQGHRKAMAYMNLSIPGMSGASFAMQQNLFPGTVTGQFSLSGNEIQTTSWMQSSDTTNNLFFTQFTYTGSGTQTVTVSFAEGASNTFPASSGSSGSVLYYNVAADPATTFDGYNTCQVRIASSVVGATGTVSGSNLSFTLTPGITVTLASSIMSNYDSASYQTQSISNVNGMSTSTVGSDLSAHEAWWSNFWSQSYVEIPDKTIEKEYYGSLYLLASISEPNEYPPGLWGPWVDTDPDWNGDFTLNYNYEVPFLASFPTNHVTLADSYDAPVVNWVPSAESLATSNGYTGAYYRVHIGPLPNGSADTSIHNQKFNNAYAATVMLEHYYVTQSSTYAASIWPTIEEMATFWQNYLSWNGTSYDILEDAQQEDDAYPQTNGVMSIGLVRNLLQGAIDISTLLGESSSQRSTWQTELNGLTTYSGLPFPTFTQGGLQVFEWTQVGRQWDNGNTIGIQHIYPGNQIGRASSSTLLTISNNMINEMTDGTYGTRWTDGNGTDTFYPAAARIGYNPTTILSQLDSWIDGNTYPNLHIHTGGGGEENLNTVPSAVSEMLMQSFQGNIILFNDWPSGTNAHFGDNLAYGNFLVSSTIANNAVQYVRIISQAGKTVSITNPWPGQSAQFYRNGTNEGTLSGTTFSITTATNDVILLGPSGSTYATLTSELGETLSQLGTANGLPYNVNAIYTNGTTFGSGGGIDGGGHALSATLLGTSTSWNGTTLTYGPSNQLDGFSNVTIPLTAGTYSSLNVLALAVNGSQASQTFTVHYADGTTLTDTQSISDWCSPQSYSGETKVLTMAYRNTSTGGELTTPTCYVYGYSLAVTSGKTVVSLSTPTSANVVVLAVQPVGGVALPYNINAIYTNGTTFGSGGGIDGAGHALSATLLGASQSWNGTTFTYGPANAVDGFSNVSIPLGAGSFSSLNILALAVNGSQTSQTFTVHYSDGTTSTDTQSISDWCSPQSYSGETDVVSMAYRNTSTGGELTPPTCYVYGYNLAANNSKTVSSLTIPANSQVVVLAVEDQQ